MSEEIYLDAPNVGELEKKYVNEAIDAGFVSTVGPFVADFETKFSSYMGEAKAVSTQSGTAALHLALLRLGIGDEDEVILPVMTFIATANPVTYVGACPVFADVDADTWNITPETIEPLITERTKAIIPVHMYGNPCDMDGIMRLADKHGLAVIEDSTESLGGTYKGKMTGTFGTFGCFSFNGNKVITTGGGGMIVGNDAEEMMRIKSLANQARAIDGSDNYSEIGFNYRMTNIEAAIGLAQMEKLEDFLKTKRRFNEIYHNELAGMERVRFQRHYEGAVSSCWLTAAIFDKVRDIDAFQRGLKARRVVTRKLFMPIVNFRPYRDHGKGGYPNANALYSKGLCLPSSTLNDEEQIIFACKNIKGLLESA
ncbi:MAG: DegT/DnrJ/EryC1/StrS family aminotransferase [Candidatus Omnitrophica bacterium]|nr:DegT/DnrJ/EryC1/StrS family aminotransferase [Candidatus Omnitrophota bacterium]MBU1128599.1 DegT/DnrJ/EryC1/StrS family aminotransferase [Candidatus Omnitrophota bacterium]MBU1784726.1 DegT/DnrJ/EryC1/StrS family aminotransferase [Candidatus Omnitrophota bacterium]MBU1851551.1 DegT/DnrJ/EryC1/StrS family aminotransferase [Candidatus Omnitrophota bacterium]